MAKQSTLVIPCDAALLYEVLTDYEHLPEWAPDVAGAKLLAREGDLALVELELRDEDGTRFAMECIHSRDRTVTWRPIEEQIPVTEAHWELASTTAGQCKVTLTVERPISMARLSSAWSNLMEPNQCLEALKNQVAMFLPDEILGETGSEKILEIIETDQGMICWLRGRKYKLVPAAETGND